MGDAELDLVVRGGTVVTATGRAEADVGVREGRIAAIGAGLAATGVREIDARGMFVLPGGVDPHVHLHVEHVEPDEPDWVDDYFSGSQAALAGGITTVGNMSYVLPWETIRDRMLAEAALVTTQGIADAFFHAAIISPTPETVAEVAPIVE